MAKKDLSKRDRELFERLRAKGIGKKLARRIASAPDVDGKAGKGGKGAKKAAKDATRRHAERWAEAEQRVMAPAQPSEAAGGDDREAPAPTGAPAPGDAALAGSLAGGPLREAVEAAGALPHLGVGPGSDLSGVSSAEVPVVPTDQLPEHAGSGGGDGSQEETEDSARATATDPGEEAGEQQGASAAIEEQAEDGGTDERSAHDEPGEVAADTPPTGEGDGDEDLTSGVTAGGMDLGAVAPADGAGAQGDTADAGALDEMEAVEVSAEDAEGGQEAQGGGDREADVDPEMGGGGSRDAG